MCFHSAPHPNGSAVLIIAAEGVQLTANEFGRRTPAGLLKDNIALIETCSDGALCSATNVFMKSNTGFSAITAGSGDVLANRGLLHLLPTGQPNHGHVGFHTWVHEDPSPLFAPHNLITRSVASSPKVIAGKCSTTPAKADTFVNGVQLASTIGNLDSSGCTVLFQEIDLKLSPVARGQALYLLVQVNVSLAKTGVSLVMDDGSGELLSASDSDSKAIGEWELHTFQLTMGAAGKARFGMNVFSKSPAAKSAAAVVEIGAVVLAPVGQPWDRLAGQ